MPAGRLHGANIAALLCRHKIRSDTCGAHPASSERIKITVCLKRGCCLCEFFLRKIRIVVVDCHIRIPGICRYR